MREMASSGVLKFVVSRAVTMPSPTNPTRTVSMAGARKASMSSCPAGRSGTSTLIGAYTSNIGSCKVIEKCNGILENVVIDPNDTKETINRYWINNI